MPQQQRLAPQRHPALPVGPAAVPPPAAHEHAIHRSHARCAALGVDARAVPDVSPVSQTRLREMRERNQRLCQHAAPVMEMLFEQIVFTRSLVVLTDSQGTILHSLGDDGFMEKAQQIALAPGVNWSEASKGTNAVGTALFDETPTLVHGAEHFVRANHFLTCSASPIFDHAGQVMGVLDVTGDQRSYHPHTLALVGLSAQMIEKHWFSDRFRQGLRLHFHPRTEMLGTVREGLLAVSPDGAILGANRAALQQLGVSAATLRMQGLEAVLGVSVGTIIDHCRRRGDEPLTLMLRTADGREEPVHLRAFFNWPTLWPSMPATVAAPPVRPAVPAPAQAATVPPGGTLEAVELDTIRRAVAAAGGNLSRAARQLGIGRNTLYRKLRKGTSPSG